MKQTIICYALLFKDEVDAFERLMRLSLKGQQEREIIHICVHCALRESSYNPFYAAVLTHFCAFHKRFRVCHLIFSDVLVSVRIRWTGKC